MIIRVDRRKEDVLSFLLFDRWYSQERKKRRIFAPVISGLALTVLFLSFVGLSRELRVTSNFGFFLTVVLVFLTGYFSYKSLLFSRLSRFVDKVSNDPLASERFGLITYEFTENSICWTSNGSKGEFAASIVKKIREDLKYFYLYISSYEAIVIPKESFSAEHDQLLFRELLDSRMKSNS